MPTVRSANPSRHTATRTRDRVDLKLDSRAGDRVDSAIRDAHRLWEERNGMAPGGMGADPERSLDALQRLSREPSLTPREAALVDILRGRLVRLLRRKDR